MKKALAVLLAVLMLGTLTALAESGVPPAVIEDTLTVFKYFSGEVTEVIAYDDARGGFMYNVFIETADSGPISFNVDQESGDLTGAVPEKGDVFKGYYDIDRPIPLIWPPNYYAFSYAVNPGETEYLINGEKLDAPEPFMLGKELMVPVRAICEALGHTVRWNSEENVAELGAAIRFSLISEYYIVGRMAPIELGSSPVIINDTAFVPLSFFRNVVTMNNAYFAEGQVVINNEEKME